MSSAREQRFVGNGNHWVIEGKQRAWLITCNDCDRNRTISLHHGHNIAPKKILEKLVREGWIIGGRPDQDRCKECQRKPIKAAVPLAAKAIAEAAAPMVVNGSQRITFAELIVIAKTLDAPQAKQLIEVLRTRIPPPQPRAPKPVLKVPTSEDAQEYKRWLEEQ